MGADQIKEFMAPGIHSARPFFMFARSLMQAPIDNNAKVLYCVLGDLAGENGYCYPSMTYLSRYLRVSRRSIIRWLQTLEECRLIYRKKRYKQGKQTTNRYYFPTYKYWRFPETDDDLSDKDVTAPGDKDVTAPGDKDVTLNDTKQERNKAVNENGGASSTEQSIRVKRVESRGKVKKVPGSTVKKVSGEGLKRAREKVEQAKRSRRKSKTYKDHFHDLLTIFPEELRDYSAGALKKFRYMKPDRKDHVFERAERYVELYNQAADDQKPWFPTFGNWFYDEKWETPDKVWIEKGRSRNKRQAQTDTISAGNRRGKGVLIRPSVVVTPDDTPETIRAKRKKIDAEHRKKMRELERDSK